MIGSVFLMFNILNDAHSIWFQSITEILSSA